MHLTVKDNQPPYGIGKIQWVVLARRWAAQTDKLWVALRAEGNSFSLMSLSRDLVKATATGQVESSSAEIMRCFRFYLIASL